MILKHFVQLTMLKDKLLNSVRKLSDKELDEAISLIALEISDAAKEEKERRMISSKSTNDK